MHVMQLLQRILTLPLSKMATSDCVYKSMLRRIWTFTNVYFCSRFHTDCTHNLNIFHDSFNILTAKMPAIMMNSFATSCRKTMRRSSLNNNNKGLQGFNSMNRSRRSVDLSSHAQLHRVSSDVSTSSSDVTMVEAEDFDTWGHFVELWARKKTVKTHRSVVKWTKTLGHGTLRVGDLPACSK